MRRDTSKLLAIKLAVSLGKQLQNKSYRLGFAYVQGFTQHALAEYLQQMPKYAKYGEQILEHAVRFALKGNGNTQYGEVYRGVVSESTYNEHRRRHQGDSAKLRTIEGKRERKGIYGLDTTRLRENALKGARKRGLTPWVGEELSEALGLSLLEMFKMNGHISYRSMANHLNREYHQGRAVRTEHSVRDALKRLQESLSKERVVKTKTNI